MERGPSRAFSRPSKCAHRLETGIGLGRGRGRGCCLCRPSYLSARELADRLEMRREGFKSGEKWGDCEFQLPKMLMFLFALLFVGAGWVNFAHNQSSDYF